MSTSNETTKYVTVQQVAKKIGKTPRTVQRMMKNGDIIPHISGYSKAHPGISNSAYLIRPRKSFFYAERQTSNTK